MSTFSKILIANRSEIAVRVIRGAHALGYNTVAVYSDADRDAPHVHLADEAVCIGAAPVGESYLVIEKILDAAKKTGADAIHPGYGFLSENADFAKACEQARIVFIGPSAESIDLMGNKRAAKELMMAAKVPCLPGYNETDQDEALLIQAAEKIGVPLMVKAAAGGGGRGMRLVEDIEKVATAIKAARSEAESAFGSGELILERAVMNGRHVEIQVFADQHGNVVHLGERDCSVQRRHQKIIEESPSPAVSETMRASMGEAAVTAARTINYVGAGTVEFLLDETGEFYFLEMNTRLQVEHPVTEMVTGQDLVQMQLLVAAGEPLHIAQDDITFTGHALEVRLYAENAYDNFMPQTGQLVYWQEPEGEGVRVDAGIHGDFEVSHYYDPMLAKIITYGANREQARRRMIRALGQTTALGLTTNKSFLVETLKHNVFAAGQATTHFIEKYLTVDGSDQPAVSSLSIALAAVLLSANGIQIANGWRSTGSFNWLVKVGCNEEELLVDVTRHKDQFSVIVDTAVIDLCISESGENQLNYESDGVLRSACYAFSKDESLYLDVGSGADHYTEISQSKAAEAPELEADILAPMNGKVIEVKVTEGEHVEQGQVVAILEAMKIQHELAAGKSGTVKNVLVEEGQQIGTRYLMLEIEEDNEAE